MGKKYDNIFSYIQDVYKISEKKKRIIISSNPGITSETYIEAV